MILSLFLTVLSARVSPAPDSALVAAVFEVVLSDATEYRKGDRPTRVWLLPEATGRVFRAGRFGSRGDGRIQIAESRETAVECDRSGCKIKENGIAVESTVLSMKGENAQVDVEYQVQWLGPGSTRDSPALCPRKIRIFLSKAGESWKVDQVRSLREC